MIDLYRNRKHLRMFSRAKDEPNTLELELDNSTLAHFTCPRKFFYYSVMGRDAIPTTALIFGGNLHKGLDCLHRTSVPDLAEQVVIDAFAERPTAEGEWRNLSYARSVIRRYHEEYKGFAQYGLPALHDENGPMIERHFRRFMFELDINEPCNFPPSLLIRGEECSDDFTTFIGKVRVFWTGRRDLVMDKNGIWNVDHKTTSVDSSGFWADFDLSPQMIGYVWALQQDLKRHIAGVMINAIFLRKDTATGKGTTFSRMSYKYSDFKIKEWFHDTRETIFLALESLVEGSYRKHPGSCIGKYAICPYHCVCTKDTETQREMMLGSDLFAEKVWSPLTEELAIADSNKINPEVVKAALEELPFVP